VPADAAGQAPDRRLPSGPADGPPDPQPDGTPAVPGREPEPELLVVIDPAVAGPVGTAAAAALRRFGPVTGVLPPRLALVASQPDRAGEIAGLPGVVGVFAGPVPPALRETFTPGEELFVDGWLARVAGKPLPRPGEGEPWDSPDRLPPDPCG
jgi:hypothetical protein